MALLKYKNDIPTSNVLQKILDISGRKPIKILRDKNSEIYNRPTKSWLQGNEIKYKNFK